jgi:hypothetical protein
MSIDYHSICEVSILLGVKIVDELAALVGVVTFRWKNKD